MNDHHDNGQPPDFTPKPLPNGSHLRQVLGLTGEPPLDLPSKAEGDILPTVRKLQVMPRGGAMLPLQDSTATVSRSDEPMFAQSYPGGRRSRAKMKLIIVEKWRKDGRFHVREEVVVKVASTDRVLASHKPQPIRKGAGKGPRPRRYSQGQLNCW